MPDEVQGGGPGVDPQAVKCNTCTQTFQQCIFGHPKGTAAYEVCLDAYKKCWADSGCVGEIPIGGGPDDEQIISPPTLTEKPALHHFDNPINILTQADFDSAFAEGKDKCWDTVYKTQNELVAMIEALRKKIHGALDQLK
jgi:hypothetical protein